MAVVLISMREFACEEICKSSSANPLSFIDFAYSKADL